MNTTLATCIRLEQPAERGLTRRGRTRALECPTALLPPMSLAPYCHLALEHPFPFAAGAPFASITTRRSASAGRSAAQHHLGAIGPAGACAAAQAR